MRRQQRGLGKYELRKAMKNGRCTVLPGGQRLKYRFKDLIVIVDRHTKAEITSYKAEVDIPYHDIPQVQQAKHEQARKANQEQPQQCKSHSILLVDTSGSMRTSDVQGCRSRLAAVFLAIAEDFIKPRIETGGAGAQDAVSVILMGEQPFLWMEAWPTDYITYNAFLRALKEGFVEAKGHCSYKPSIDMAHSLFNRYDAASCRLLLGVMSDGRPSDSRVFKLSWERSVESISASIESLASKVGNRLAVRAIGMGSANQWQTLETLCEVARNYGCEASISTPSMSSSSLGAVVSSIATSLTASQLNDDKNGGVKRVRPVRREDRSRVPLLTEAVDPEEFDIFMDDSVVHEVHVTGDAFQQVPFQHPDARGVAIRKQPFAEGSERFAYQFFEVAQDGRTVVGSPLIAKACKFVRENGDEDSLEVYTHKFLTRFCRIQKMASKIASAYNQRLDSIRRLDSDTPRIEFVPCSVYRIQHHDGTALAYVVEPRLFGKFSKWNSNNGWIRENIIPSPVKSTNLFPPGLATIKEEDETRVAIKEQPMQQKETTDDVLMATVVSDSVIDLTTGDDDDDDGEDERDMLFVQADDVAQAFSHFSYTFERQRILVCDLQGVYDRQHHMLRFTDPVIHYLNRANERVGTYGRTDRGGKGIADFLGTHSCNCLCNVVTKGFLPVKSTTFEK